jgi:6-phosphogluconolactonase
MKSKVRKIKNVDELYIEVANFILHLAKETVNYKGRFSIALSGGKTPVKLYERLGEPNISNYFPWRKTHVFWSDERCVPPEHEDSNFKMAKEALLSKINIPDGNIHRILAEIKPPEKAAEFYENDVKSYFGEESSQGASFDLMLLGLGIDGHTASLFPGSPALNENERLVAAVQAPKGLRVKNRISFTLPLINNSSCVLFLALGAEKKKIVTAILEKSDKSQALYPAALVYPEGRLIWFVDE